MAVNSIRGMRQPQREADSGARLWPLRAQTIMGLLFLVALLAFEIFNFDTTRFALVDFLGEASFAGLRWAAVLAIAFCAIDFAGLLRFFLPQDEEGQAPAELWYLMGAWLLGATMNALMTWWAVNLALLNHDFGNEVLSRQQLLEIVPIFVATLVWVTRILFIGAFTVAGGYLFNLDRLTPGASSAQEDEPLAQRQAPVPLSLHRNTGPSRRSALRSGSVARLAPVTDDLPPFLQNQGEDEQDVAEDEEEATFESRGAWPTRISPHSAAGMAQER